MHARVAGAAPEGDDPFGGGSIGTDLQAGAHGHDIGDVWVKRAPADSGFGEVLLVRINLVGEGLLRDTSVCVKPTPFTERELAGRCTGRLSETAGRGTSAGHLIELGFLQPGQTVYVQVHAGLSQSMGGHAFGGWLAGPPTFGNLDLPAPAA